MQAGFIRQLAIREIIGNNKLDEILEAKERISGEIYQALKELEYLERICGKIGEISVNGNAGIVE